MKRPDRRTTILATAAILAIFASILPLVVLSELQRQQALERQRINAGDYARWTAMRVERTLADAKQTLIRAQAIDKTDCSPDHIRQMEQVILDSHSVRHIGYFRNGAVVCSRLGVLSPPMPRGEAELDLGDGYVLSYGAQPRLFRSELLVELRHGDYGVLIGRGQLTDLVGQNTMTLGVATEGGRVLELSGPAELEAVQKLLSGQRFGTRDRYIFASQPAEGLVAFVLADRQRPGVVATTDWRYVLPVGFAISFALIGIIIWVSRQQLSPEKSLELAIRKREFAVHYQPITEIATGRCVAAEALVRWRRPDGRMIPPDQFIPLAEASGLISPLTDLVIEIVMTEMGALLRDNADLHVSINIPACDMESGRFLPGLSKAVAKAAIEPSQVWLEVTERAVMNVAAAQDRSKPHAPPAIGSRSMTSGRVIRACRCSKACRLTP